MSINENMAEPNAKVEDRVPIPSSWNTLKMLKRGRLTDRKISGYQKRGWYSQEYRLARRELWEQQKARREKRQGNFIAEKGRLIYAPT